LVVLLALFGAARPCHAQTAPAGTVRDQGFILLVRSAGDEGVVARVRAELIASGFRIVELRRDDRLERLSLSDLARKQGATAAVRINAHDPQIELWVARADVDAGVSERIVADSKNTNDAVLALRTTEALRAHGLRIEPIAPSEADNSQKNPNSGRKSDSRPSLVPATRERKPAAAKPASAAGSTAQKPDDNSDATNSPEDSGSVDVSDVSAGTASFGSRKLSFELAPAIISSPGGLEPAFDVWTSGRFALYPRWTLGVVALVPTLPQTVRGTEGSANVWTFLLGVSSDVHLVQAARWEFSLGAGVASAMTLMRGKASGSEYVSTLDIEFATAPFAQTALHFTLSERFRVFARGMAGATIPEVSVHFGEREVAHWGQPFAVVSLGVEFIALTATNNSASGR
jgi:hypothetical protein